MNTSLNILHISSPISWRGGEQQLYYLHTGLKAQGYNSKVYCPNESTLATKLDISERVLYNKRSGFDVIAAYQLKVYCRKNKVDLIHAHDAHAHTTSVIAASLFGNKPPIILSRRVDFPIGKSKFSRYKYNHKKIRVIACVSEVIQKMVVPKIYNQNIEVKTIHSGVDLNRFNKVKPVDLRAEYNINASMKIVANFSALADHKDYFTFIRTAEIVSKTRKDIIFLIFGVGELHDQLIAFTQSLNLQEVVKFVGFRKDLPAVYPNIDALLFTSKTEGLGTTILDAFASHVPVIATNAGGIPEMVENNVTGLLSEIGDAESLASQVLEVISNESLSKKITTNALIKANDFSVDQMISKTIKTYTNVLNKSFILKPNS